MDKLKWQQLRARYRFTTLRWRTFLVIAFDLCVLGVALRLSSMQTPYFVLSIILWVYVFLHAYIFLHEATHTAISRHAPLNNMIGHIVGWMILMPFLPRQSSHILHHTWTGHPHGDPANRRLIQRFSVITEKQANKLEFIWKYWCPLFAINDRVGLWRAPFQQRNEGVATRRTVSEIRASYFYGAAYLVFLVVLILSGTLGNFLSWYLPAMFSLFFLEELVNLPHHAETPLLHEDDKALPFWEQHRVTHSCKSVPFWSSFILLNFNLHTAHHFFPTAPWYGLPKLHDEIKHEIPDFESGQQTQNELTWSLEHRQLPLLKIMGHYFRKNPAPAEQEGI